MSNVKDILEAEREHERQHKCRVVSSQIKEGKIVSRQCVPFDTVEPYAISVSSCTPFLIKENRALTSISTEVVEIPENQSEFVDTILREAINSVGGWINQSGIYPLPPKYYKKLKEKGIL